MTCDIPLTLQVNATSYPVEIEADRTLLSVLRGELGLTGSKEGCDDSECGACMVLRRRPAGEFLLVPRAPGRRPPGHDGRGARVGHDAPSAPAGFLDQGGVQCGFCTPGMLISATALLAANPDPTDDEIRAGLSGNLCRCTGYVGIVAAVRSAAKEMANAD